jgi:hypothetical protein
VGTIGSSKNAVAAGNSGLASARTRTPGIGGTLVGVGITFAFIAGCKSSAGESGSSGTGGDGGPPPACVPSANSGPVADTCGVFVSSEHGDDTNGKGTQAAPYKSIGKALTKGSTIYVCAGTTPYSEPLSLDTAVTLFGALDCGTWGYNAAKKTQLTAAADMVPLTLASTASGSEVQDCAITAADATTAGGSSIAVIADGVTASLTRTDVIAGNGKAGVPGTTPTTSVGPTDPTDPTIAGNPGNPACMATSQELGGAAVTNPRCNSIGGAGGIGEVSSGSNGDASPPTPQTAQGGQGQPSNDMGMWSCVVGAGSIGANGGTGTSGLGAQAGDLGALDAKSGYTGIAGKPGGAGSPGQGGGGGGGAKGKMMCAGASGGSGGAGGCGGNGGTGGQPGGSSIGIANLGATLAFDAVRITVGVGGKGGDGAPGQGGGVGGKGGSGGLGDPTAPATAAACDGGNGGPGGTGGQGGGGRGGHAIGIAYTGMTAPSTMGVSFMNQGTPGQGGTGDDSNNNMGDGAKGVGADVQEF